MSLYISCGLTHVPRDDFAGYVSFIHSLAQAIARSTGEQVHYALRDTDPQLAQKPPRDKPALCYLWDRELVENSDLVVADATYPAIGLGIELQIATAKGLPIVLCYNASARFKAPQVTYLNPDKSEHTLQVGEGYVSLMALGLPSVFRVVPYTDPQEGAASIVEAVQLLIRPQPANG